MKTAIILITLIFRFCHGESEFEKKIEFLKNIDVPDIEDFDIIREKCEKEGGNGTYDKLKVSFDTIGTCINDFVDIKIIKTEIENSKKTGALDEVFGKYCAKRFKLATCLEDFVNNLRSCLNDEEKNALNITTNILAQLSEFVCYKDGDRIAIFFAEGGTECFKARAQGIQNCVNATLKIIPSGFNSNPLQSLLIDKKKCDNLSKLQDCMVEELEKCSDTTPANIIDALFRFIKRSTCSKKNRRSISFHRILRRSTLGFKDITNITEVTDHFINLYKKKCIQNVPNFGLNSPIYKSFIHMGICLNILNEDGNFTTGLTLEKHQLDFKECTDDFVEKAEMCFGKEEKYYPKFMQQLYFSLSEWAYKHKDAITNKTTMNKFSDCFKILKRPENRTPLTYCFSKWPEPQIWKKEVICEIRMNFAACAIDIVKRKCTRDYIFDELTDDFITAWKAVCKPNQN
ncbi:uncharacterized protein LOC123015047 [Tribolium madens]|uniref:uncharacterized protein LOC123015047 n=1 Tax=Tribolium madens TaxID=41895 RepID=UPI001CF75F5E|nr:uncharacterized protein LOC123015047 [Tribolium madens]